MQSAIVTADVDKFLDYVFTVAELVAVPARIRPALRDPDDDRVLDVAVRARATVITFNVRDFAGSAAHGIEVERPVDFLRRLGESL